jgi:probable HAF family extracellular repeat protein
VALTAVFVPAAAFAQTSFTALGDLAGGTVNGRANAISPNGQVAAGFGNDGTDGGARWIVSGGTWSAPLALPRLAAGAAAQARACSNDGAAVFGEANDSNGFRQPVRWQIVSGVPTRFNIGFPPAGGYSGVVYGCSADGTVACGENLFAPVGVPPPLPITQAFRWTAAGGAVNLGTLPGTPAVSAGVTTARAMSSDGSVIVGYGLDSSSTYHPWRWTAATGIVDISGGQWPGFGRGCSPDGNMVVGSRTVNGDTNAFLWTNAGGVADLGTILDFNGVLYTTSAALDASLDGHRLCGLNTATGQPQLASIWDAGRGWRSVKQILSDAGINMTGWTLLFSNSMSDDGLTIAGHATNPSGQTVGWVATIPPLCAADFDDGSGTGVPDGGVGIEDLLYYLLTYDGGSSRADVDNGSGYGVPDRGVGIEDLLYYLGRYDAGC